MRKRCSCLCLNGKRVVAELEELDDIRAFDEARASSEEGNSIQAGSS